MPRGGSWAVYPHTPTYAWLRAASGGINSPALPAAAGKSPQVESRGLLEQPLSQGGDAGRAVLAAATLPRSLGQ